MPNDASLIRSQPPNDLATGRGAGKAANVLQISALAALFTIAVYAWLYIQTGAWQALIIVAGMSLGSAGLWRAYRLSQRNNLAAAERWLLLMISIAMLSTEFALADVTAYNIVCGLLLIVVAGTIFTQPDKNITSRIHANALVVAVLFLAGIGLINYFTPIPRYDTGNNLYLRIYIGLITTFLTILSLWQILSSVYQRSIRTRMLVAFILVVLSTVTAISFAASLNTANSIQQRTLSLLQSVASLKEGEIQTWVQRMHSGLSDPLAEADLIRLRTIILRKEYLPTETYQLTRTRLQERLVQSMARTGLFEEFFILDLSGKVLISTLSEQEGKIFTSNPFYQQGLTGKVITPPYFSPSHNSYIVMAAQPLYDDQKNKIGVIAGRANMQALNTIMSVQADMGTSGETYLVGANHALLTASRTAEIGAYIRSEGANQAIGTHQAGAGEYTNESGEQVFGAYRWVPDLQLVLLAEESRSEVFEPILQMFALNVGVALISLILAVAAALAITRSIANPIAELARVTRQIAAGQAPVGNLGSLPPTERSDELGDLTRSFDSMARQVRELIGGLEERVASRTGDLERRTTQLQAAAEVARDITLMTDPDELLKQAVNLIRDRFGFYHAGLFLVDESSGEAGAGYAVLRAATGEAGREMLAKGHRLKVGQEGIVGFVTGSGQSRIALDVGLDATHFKNPLLPLTRSELALPLRLGNRIIGAIDVQSVEPAAFTSEDITVLQIMADQLAIAIQNARLLERMNRTVGELESAYGRYTQESWRSFIRSVRQARGYRLHQSEVQPVSRIPGEAQAAIQQQQTIIATAAPASGATTSAGAAEPGKPDSQPAAPLLEAEASQPTSTLAVPIKLRNQVIGVLNLRFNGSAIPWETVVLVEEAAVRLALVLENARLLQEAQRLALREQQINTFATQVRSSTNMETILQNTVRELGKALGASRTFIQIGPAAASGAGSSNAVISEGNNGS